MANSHPRVVAVLAAVRRRRWGMACLFAAVALATVLALGVAPRTYRFEMRLLCQFAPPLPGEAAGAEMAGFLRTQREILLSDAVVVPAAMRLRPGAGGRSDKSAERGCAPEEVRAFALANAPLVDLRRRSLRVRFSPGRHGSQGTLRIRFDLPEERAGLWAGPSPQQVQAQGREFLLDLLRAYHARRAELESQRQEIALSRLDGSGMDAAFEALSRSSAALDGFRTQARRRDAERAVRALADTAPSGPMPWGGDILGDFNQAAQQAQFQCLLKDAQAARLAYEQAAQSYAQARRQIRQDPMVVLLLEGPRLSGPEPIRPRRPEAMGWGVLAAALAAGLYLAAAEGVRFLRGAQGISGEPRANH